MILKQFLQARGLERPDGRPLYAYRCSPTESANFRDFLTNSLSTSGARIGPTTTQAFCLWAADYWRRTHSDGAWAWSTVLDTLGAEHLGPRQPGYQKLQGMVAEGLTAWDRELLKLDGRSLYLVTLACEGGLPLQLVVKEQARLRNYFRTLFREYQAHTVNGRLASDISAAKLAQRVAFLLPTSLRNDVVFVLSSQLVASVAEYARRVQGEANPVAALDQRFPEWRGKMPLDLADDVATEFLNGLVYDATSIAQQRGPRIGWRRSLRRSNASAEVEWLLIGRLDLPSLVPLVQFQAVFPQTALSGKFDLLLRTAGREPEPVAIGTIRVKSDSVALEKLRSLARGLRGAAAGDGQSVVYRGLRGQSAESHEFRGATPLSELPWVFAVQARSDPGDFDLIGEGTVRCAAGEVFVVAPRECRVERMDGAECTIVGTLQGVPDRLVYHLKGAAAFVDPQGARCFISTNVTGAAEMVEYRLVGNRQRYGRSAEEYYLGMPHVYVDSETGISLRLEPYDLQWRNQLPGSSWSSAAGPCVGDGFLRYSREGELRFSSHVRVLPKSFSVEIQPEKGECGSLRVGGLDNASIEIDAPGVDAVIAHSAGDAAEVRLSARGEAPATVELRLVWPLRGQTRLSLPFPANVVCFRSITGRRIASESRIAVDQLARYRAYALVPRRFAEYHVEGNYRASNPRPAGAAWAPPELIILPLDETVPGLLELDLSALERPIKSVLYGHADLDGHVKVMIASNDAQQGPLVSLQVSQYDLRVTVDPLSRIQLEPDALARLEPREVAALTLRAFPVHDPDTEPLALEPVASATWAFPADASPGPWLVAGWDGDWCRVRPMAYVVSGQPPEVPADSLAWASLQQQDRTDHVRRAIERMAGDPNSADWSLVRGYLRWTDDFPAATFDALRELVKQPVAAALTALIVLENEICAVDEDDHPAFDRMWRNLETLPFSWCAISFMAWREAIARWLSARSASLTEVEPETRSELVASLYQRARRCIASEQRLRWLAPVFDSALLLATSTPLSDDTRALRHYAVQYHLANEYLSLITNHPFGAMAGADLPECRRVYEYFTAANAHDDLTKHQRVFNTDTRKQWFINAPLVAAACAAQGIALSADAQVQMRNAESYEPQWFDDAYYWAYLYLLARQSGREPTFLTS